MFLIELKTEPAHILFTVSVYFGGIDDDLKKFQAIGLKPNVRKTHSGDDHDTYKFEFNDPLDVFKAGIVVLQHYVYRNDSEFCDYADKVLTLYQGLKKGSQLSVDDENSFLKILLKKHQDLFAVQQQLQTLAKFLQLDSVLDFHELNDTTQCATAVEEIQKLEKENKKLYDIIVEEARNKANNYNETAVKAIIMAISSSYLKRNHEELMQQAENSYQQHPHNRPVPFLPHPNKVYPYIEADIEFPNLHKSVARENVQNLAEKIHRLFENHDKTQKDLTNFEYYFTIIKNFFNALYEKILVILSDLKEGNLIEKNSDLAQNMDNIVNGSDVITEKAQKLHRYNSRPSPLIAVIHDKTLSPEERLDFLEKLSLAKAYRFSHENQESRLNIEINGGKPRIGSEKILEGIYLKSPLQHAIEFGTLSEAQMLVKQGASLETKGDLYLESIDGSEVTALHIAVAKGDLEKVKLLVDAGANVNAVNKIGQTPLYAAKDWGIANYLILNGANIHQRDKDLNTPLHHAAHRNNLVLIEGLLQQKNISVDAKNDLGNTPLHLASHYGVPRNERSPYFVYSNPKKGEDKDNLAIMQALVLAKADVNQSNKFGYTPLLLAVNMREDCLGDQTGTDDVDLLFMKNKVRFLCEKGANPNAITVPLKEECSNKYNPSPLATPLLSLYAKSSFFEKNNHFEQRKLVAEVLVKHGADPKKLDRYADSLLHYCAKKGDSTGLEYFLELGLDPNYQSSAKKTTPLHDVFYSKTSNEADFQMLGKPCIDVLLKFGADPHKTTLQQVTIDTETQNPKFRGIYLQDPIIKAVFENDNIVSQLASQKNINPCDNTYSAADRRKLLLEIWKEQGEKSIKIELPMSPELHGHCNSSGSNSYFIPCSKAIQYMEEYRESYYQTKNNCNF